MTAFSGSTYGAAIAPVMARPYRLTGRKVGILGDSIPNGVGASQTDRAFPQVLPKLLSSSIVNPLGFGMVVSGHSGFRAFEVEPFLYSDIFAGGCDTVVFEPGTNDAALGTTMVDYAACMLRMFKAAKARGLRIVVCTVPPHGATFAASVRTLTDAYNVWLRLVVPSFGILVDIYHGMVLPSNGGYINAALAFDQTHPNDMGHLLYARLIDAAIRNNTFAPAQLIDGFSTLNMIANPYFLTNSSGWNLQGGGTGTATWSRITDSTGFFTTGSAYEMDGADAGVQTLQVYVNSFGGLGTAWNPGDTLAITCKMQVQDVSGDWDAKNITNSLFGGTAYGNITVNNVNAVSGYPVNALIADAKVQHPGRLVSPGLYQFGPDVRAVRGTGRHHRDAAMDRRQGAGRLALQVPVRRARDNQSHHERAGHGPGGSLIQAPPASAERLASWHTAPISPTSARAK
jgi:hypothetical protein